MNPSGGVNPGLGDVVTGAQVGHHGMLLGSVEEVITNVATGQPEAVLVRHGRADYLLRVPAQYLRPESPSRVEIDDGVELDALEREALSSGRAPPTGEHIVDSDQTAPSPSAEELMGSSEGMPRSYDGPATG